MQVDPIKPALKAPGTKCLKLNCDEPLSNVAFKFNLRRYIMDAIIAAKKRGRGILDKHSRPTLNRRTEAARLYMYSPRRYDKVRETTWTLSLA